ncbi:MAG: chemotaxis protein CheW [Xenococcus sp. MO_188.B8]|nr:chemotaxis protein CheW [Xenococcus sp. MO_188.B8]
MNITAQVVTKNINQEERYLVAQVEDKKVAFSAHWVQEILVFQRSQILQLPFYDQCLLGVIHHQNQIVPLVSGRKIFLETTKKITQVTLTAVRLNQFGQNLAGVGVVVDCMVGNLSAKELTQEQLFEFTDIPQQIWQPDG